MSKGLKYSLIFHLLFIISSFIFISRTSEVTSTERIITVDLVNIKPGDTTNLKNSPIMKNNKASKKDTLATAKPEAVKPAEKVNPIVVPMKKAKHEVKEKLSKAEARVNKEMDKLLDNLEKNIPSEDLANTKNKTQSGKENLAMSDKPYDKSLPMTLAEQANIKMQIERKFSTPIVSDFNVGEIIIRIKLDMKKNGELENIVILNSSSYSTRHSDAFTALKDSLVRAVHMASPLQGLDESRYEGRNGWKEIELVFDAYYLMHA
jgi:hypothetical protein